MKAQELKSSILKYAIEGKLVPQARDDEPASILMEKINTERQNLITEKILKREKNLPPLNNNEIPFEIPSSWVWVRLGDISNIGSFKSVTKDLIKDNDWVLDLEDIESNSGVLLKKTAKNQKSVNSNKYTFKKNNVMYGKLRPYLNKVIIAEDSGYCTTEILPLDFGSFIYNKYAKYVLMSPFFLNYVNRCSYGVKMPRLGSNDSKVAPFPLPPFEEQKRIVKKIEELFQKVNQYDYLEQKLTVLNDNFPDNMERSVLQYAMEGKLVEQRSHEIVIDLNPEKIIYSASDELISYDLPASWTAAKLGDLLKVSSGTNLTKKNMIDQGEYNVYGGNGIVGRYNQYNTEADTLIIGRVGYYCGSVHLTSSKSWVTDNAFKVNFNKEYLNLEWLYYLLINLNLRNFSSSTAQPVISGKRIYPIVIGIPPLEEQERIVEKIKKTLNNVQKLRLV